MDSIKIGKQMITFQKTVFDNSFNALSVVQDQTETMIRTFIEQSPFSTDESKKQLNEIFEYTRQARDTFKKSIDEGYGQIAGLFEAK